MSAIFKITVGFSGPGSWQAVSSMLVTSSQDGGFRLEDLKNTSTGMLISSLCNMCKTKNIRNRC